MKPVTLKQHIEEPSYPLTLEEAARIHRVNGHEASSMGAKDWLDCQTARCERMRRDLGLLVWGRCPHCGHDSYMLSDEARRLRSVKEAQTSELA